MVMFFSENFLQQWNPIIKAGCVIHDVLSDFLVRYLKQVKIILLMLAHLSLIGFLFPQFGRSFGNFAQNLLLVILLVSPLSKLFRMKLLYQLMSLRRELGIWFAYMAIVHSLSYILNPEWFGTFIALFLSQPLSMMPRYLFGVLALILTLPLLITSNTLSLTILKGNWKKLHWLVYPLFAFMLLHIFLPRRLGIGNDIFGFLQASLAFGAYVLLKMLAKNNFLTPLREVNEYVAQRYVEYRSSSV
jgi:DMSO/TMAO reductase YedYZ heme-binding membrane subunit